MTISASSFPHGRLRNAALVVTLLLCIWAICSCSDSNAPGRARGEAPVPVTAAPARAKDVPIELSAFGTVEAYSTVAIRSAVSGILTNIHFQRGQAVKKGDPLFTIDPRPFQAAMEQAQANLERDRVQLQNAEREAAREKGLSEKGVSSQFDYEKAVTDVAVLQQAIKADAAAVDNMKLQLEHSSISSPIDGKTGNIYVDVGNLVQANNVTLVTINQVQPVRVYFSIPGRDLSTVNKYSALGRSKIAPHGGLPVRAWTPDAESAPVSGELTFVDNAIDKESSTVLLGATFPNEDRQLWPGQYVHVAVTLTVQKDAVVVPLGAVQTSREGKLVFVIKADGTAEIRPVKVGPQSGDDIVIEEGVKAGEMVVTDGQLRLVPGSKVAIAAPGRGGDQAAPTGGARQ